MVDQLYVETQNDQHGVGDDLELVEVRNSDVID